MKKPNRRIPNIAGSIMLGAVLVAGQACTQAMEDPSLVVVIVVDQLRGDMLDQYDEAFSGGFRRLLDDGYRYTNASHPFAVTHTAAGHASISTGVPPSRSGIVANTWSQRTGEDWRQTYCVADDESPILGFEDPDGIPGRSPKNLLRGGLADWMREADDNALTVSLSAKDRSAITLAGKTNSHVYWLLHEEGRFVTSQYYAQAYPDWVQRFNEEVMPVLLADTIWESGVPVGIQPLARPDFATYERRGNSTFPHISSVEEEVHNEWAFDSPKSDEAVLALATIAMEELALGQRGSADFLALGLSSTDYIGHLFGPLSQEQLSNLIHLDRVLGEFFDYLDTSVGEGEWVVALSADHGVATMPEYAQEQGNTSARRINAREKARERSSALRAALAEGGSPEDIAERLARQLEAEGTVAKAYTHRELTLGEPADSFAILFSNSHYPGRGHGALSRYGVETRYGEGELLYGANGTSHGTPYWYDRHVPVIFYGKGIDAGVSDAPAYTTDIAPTLAHLAGIVTTPDDLDGRVIYTAR
jgi:predicted AlkP superfamily pyrophosphatase or phosphodiesterase